MNIKEVEKAINDLNIRPDESEYASAVIDATESIMNIIGGMEEDLTLDKLEQIIHEQSEITFYDEALKYIEECDPSMKFFFKEVSAIGYNVSDLNSSLIASIGLEAELIEIFQPLLNALIDEEN